VNFSGERYFPIVFPIELFGMVTLSPVRQKIAVRIKETRAETRPGQVRSAKMAHSFHF
jgi:hypothetical protein